MVKDITKLSDGALQCYSDRQYSGGKERARCVEEMRKRGLIYNGMMTREAIEARREYVARVDAGGDREFI